jgi:predicted Zn-ribbon and HTH transcriptional regulator
MKKPDPVIEEKIEDDGGTAENLEEALSQAVDQFAGELEEEAIQEEAAEAAHAAANPKMYITKHTQIDKFTIKAERVLITPAVCDKCGFDVSQRNNLGNYDEMTPIMQQQVKDAIAEHKNLVHTTAQDLVVSEDQLPTEWLGNHKKF